MTRTSSKRALTFCDTHLLLHPTSVTRSMCFTPPLSHQPSLTTSICSAKCSSNRSYFLTPITTFSTSYLLPLFCSSPIPLTPPTTHLLPSPQHHPSHPTTPPNPPTQTPESAHPPKDQLTDRPIHPTTNSAADLANRRNNPPLYGIKILTCDFFQGIVEKFSLCF